MNKIPYGKSQRSPQAFAEAINNLIDEVNLLKQEVEILKKGSLNPRIGGPNGRFIPLHKCEVCGDLTEKRGDGNYICIECSH